MIIKEVNLKNFGRFCEQKFQFSEGLNVIYGANETGKTTLYHAIGALLFGLEKQRGRAARSDTYTTYQPWENQTRYEGSLRFESGGKHFFLERSFYHREKSARLVCEEDGEELSVAQGDLKMLLGDIGAELFYNTAAVGQLKMKPQDVVYSYLENYIAGAQEKGNHATDVVKALAVLDAKKKALEQQKKKYLLQLREQLAGVEARLGLVERELSSCEEQLKAVMREKAEKEAGRGQRAKGFWARLFLRLKRLLFGRKLRREERLYREALLKLDEKTKLLRDLLGEKESLKEELEMEKEDCYQKMHEQSKDTRIEAIELAKERIQELSESGRQAVMERLLEKSSAVLSKLTQGKYRKLVFTEEREPAVWDGNRMVKLFQLSGGCADQVYLAVRIGLQDLFFEEEELPLIFDDAFVYFDDVRLERLLQYLSTLDRQILLFSCHKRELEILEKKGISCRRIELGMLQDRL